MAYCKRITIFQDAHTGERSGVELTPSFDQETVFYCPAGEISDTRRVFNQNQDKQLCSLIMTLVTLRRRYFFVTACCKWPAWDASALVIIKSSDMKQAKKTQKMSSSQTDGYHFL